MHNILAGNVKVDLGALGHLHVRGRITEGEGQHVGVVFIIGDLNQARIIKGCLLVNGCRVHSIEIMAVRRLQAQGESAYP
ncbi:hypothetical protein D3C75_1245700 [compost metagenome]